MPTMTPPEEKCPKCGTTMVKCAPVRDPRATQIAPGYTCPKCSTPLRVKSGYPI